MDRGIYSSPRVLVRVRGGAKRLAVDILLFGFQDEVSRDGKPLFDSYCEHLTEYLQYLRDCDYKADDIPNRTMVRIFWHWMDCESFRMPYPIGQWFESFGTGWIVNRLGCSKTTMASS